MMVEEKDKQSKKISGGRGWSKKMIGGSCWSKKRTSGQRRKGRGVEEVDG